MRDSKGHLSLLSMKGQRNPQLWKWGPTSLGLRCKPGCPRISTALLRKPPTEKESQKGVSPFCLSKAVGHWRVSTLGPRRKYAHLPPGRHIGVVSEATQMVICLFMQRM